MRGLVLGARVLRAARPSLRLLSASTLHDTVSDVAERSASQAGSVLARYEALLAAGTLKPDAHQAAAIQRLDRLQVELLAYKAAVDGYQLELSAYKAARQARWEEAHQHESSRLLAEEQQQHQGAASKPGAGAASSAAAFLLSWMGFGSSSSSSQPQSQSQEQQQQQQQLGQQAAGPGSDEGNEGRGLQLSRAQRRAVLSARTERRLDELLGPPPPAPPAPKGVYIHGSVGSGKSLLMDLLYTTVAHQQHQHQQPSSPAAHASAGALPHHRRLHFNSALLELHSRLHELDKHRERTEATAMEAYAAQQAQRRRSAAAAAAGAAGAAGAGGADEEQQQGGVLQAAWQQIRDPIAEKLKRSKLAKLAYRRMMRDRAGRSVEEHSQALAQSNAAVLRHAARALIRNADDTVSLMLRSTAGSRPQQPAGAKASEQQQQQGADELIQEPEAEGEDEAAAEAAEAGRIAALLCFDEMQVNDVFNAVALKGLLESLMDEGCVVVATSNRAPWELNRHGLHEDLFNHYVEALLAHCDVVRLDAEQDYRRLLGGPQLLRHLGQPPLPPSQHGFDAAAAEVQKSQGQGQGQGPGQGNGPCYSYFYPLSDPRCAEALRREWQAVAAPSTSSSTHASPAAAPCELRVMFGRRLPVARSVGGAAWFEFEELCGRPLGAADYIAVAQEFHTVFIEGLPAMSMKLRDRARRFITLVDELYNHRVRLVVSAEVPPDELFVGADNEEPIIDLESLQFETAVEGSRLRRNLMADGGVAPVASTPGAAQAAANLLGGAEERFAFARAVSRLYEMQGELYLASRPRH